MSRRWIPERGEIIWIEFDPQAGHEQAGHRPALVLSKANYNKTGLAIVCPITSRVKGYPFEVLLPSGAVLADQVKCLDWQARQAKRKGTVQPEIVSLVLGHFKLICGIE